MGDFDVFAAIGRGDLKRIGNWLTERVFSIASVSTNYQGGDGLTPELIARANEWIRQVCLNTGVWYADIASILNDDAGYLSDAYLTPDGRSVAAAGIALIVDYFRFHGVS